MPLKKLRAEMGTDDFDVCFATRDFADALDHLATVLWQDLAVLWPRMKRHPIFTVSPFSDNSFGWLTYRDRALRLQRDEQPKALDNLAEQARLRNDFETARAITSVAEVMRAPQGSFSLHESSVQLIRETHRARKPMNPN